MFITQDLFIKKIKSKKERCLWKLNFQTCETYHYHQGAESAGSLLLTSVLLYSLLASFLNEPAKLSHPYFDNYKMIKNNHKPKGQKIGQHKFPMDKISNATKCYKISNEPSTYTVRQMPKITMKRLTYDKIPHVKRVWPTVYFTSKWKSYCYPSAEMSWHV